MHVEQIKLTNFRCFGPGSHTVSLDDRLTALVGSNGAGKTALMQALLRLFGTHEQRRIVRQDFHVPFDEQSPPLERTLSIDVVFAFPELKPNPKQSENDDPDFGHGEDASGDVSTSSVPSFFLHMAADDNGVLKFRLRLDAKWTNDGTETGAITEEARSIQTLTEAFDEETECKVVSPLDRARIQVVYIPASRDALSQLTTLLRGRLWRAIIWDDKIRNALEELGSELNDAFAEQIAVNAIVNALETRWKSLYTGGTDATPILRPIDLRFDRFIKRIEAAFRPDESGRDRGLDELSDGQRSLFHIAMTAAALDVETKIGTLLDGFDLDVLPLPSLTILALEEPENNLAPFYLSRIIRQVQDLTRTTKTQALISSHSASILGRVEPNQVRHFRLLDGTRTAVVNPITLPPDSEEASKFLREAVRTYPELYFARFVILGEGSSEEVVLPRLAEAMGLDIDPSFVALVPLGGRHVNHLWRLLKDLEIPFATLLDLDDGRDGGGFGRIKTMLAQLIATRQCNNISDLEKWDACVEKEVAGSSREHVLQDTIKALREFGVFFCNPLDLDMSMLRAFPSAYKTLEPGKRGPSEKSGATEAVLGEKGEPNLYVLDECADDFGWYRYLFLGRGKPSTHLRVLSQLDDATLKRDAPEELKALLRYVAMKLRRTSVAASL